MPAIGIRCRHANPLPRFKIKVNGKWIYSNARYIWFEALKKHLGCGLCKRSRSECTPPPPPPSPHHLKILTSFRRRISDGSRLLLVRINRLQTSGASTLETIGSGRSESKRCSKALVSRCSVAVSKQIQVSLRNGRATRPRSPNAAAQGKNNIEIQVPPPPCALARWTDERLMMFCQHCSNTLPIYRIPGMTIL